MSECVHVCVLRAYVNEPFMFMMMMMFVLVVMFMAMLVVVMMIKSPAMP